MSNTQLAASTMKRIADNWEKSSSIKDAMKRSGLSVTNERTMRRYKAQTEQKLGITLTAHNEQFSSRSEIECPSTLNLSNVKKHKAFVITSAVNNSTLNHKFFDALENFSKSYNAQLLCIPIKYRHNMWMNKDDYAWSERIYPYAVRDNILLSRSLLISGIRLQATAVNPLSGMAANSGSRSAIYGATSLHLQMVPTPGDELPKMMMTTGSCTARTYTKTKAGGKAKFHHNFSAIYVQLIGNTFYHTQLMWDGKGFCFLDEYWTPLNVTKSTLIPAIIRGDDHAAIQDKKILAARASLCRKLNPDVHVFHDVFDGVSISHHHQLLDKIAVYKAGMHSLEKELKITAKLVADTGGRENWIIDSNHDRHIERYLNEGRHLKDPHNAIIGSELLAKVASTGKSALECAFEEYIPGKFEFISPNKRRSIKGIDVSQHGDRGANGSRGSLKGFASAVYKTIFGHSHSPGIYQGAWQVGVSGLNHAYKNGLSTWACADVVIYPNGKRGMFFYINNKSLADF